MSKISVTRLDELIWNVLPEPLALGKSLTTDIGEALRELRDYRKAVGEYLAAVDAWRDFTPTDNPFSYYDLRCAVEAAEATLRALQERT